MEKINTSSISNVTNSMNMYPISAEYIVFILTVFFATLMNMFGIKLLIACHKKLYPIEVTSLIILYSSLIIGNSFWLFDVSLRSIQQFNLTQPFLFVCYLTYSRQVTIYFNIHFPALN